MRIDYRDLKRRIRLVDLLAKIGWQSTQGRGEQLRGPCPLPGCSQSAPDAAANSSTLSIYASKNIYRCFRCRSAGNVLDFWQAYRTTPLHQAALELHQIAETGNHVPR